MPTPTGNWLGYLSKVQPFSSERPDSLPMLRSWLPDETIEDKEFLQALAVLRRTKPLHLSDTEQAALQLALARLSR